MPHKKLSVKQWINFKTQKCKDAQCPTMQMFNTEVRARYYQLVFFNDKCCFTCNGYHTEYDKRRKFVQLDQANLCLNQIFQCNPQYLIDFSSFQIPKSIKNLQTKDSQSDSQAFGNTCKNIVQYLYHPVNYKTKNCPFTQRYQSKNSIVQLQNSCCYEYCPFLHKDQTLNAELQQNLKFFREKTAKQRELKRPDADRKKFEDKLLNIILLRSCKSIDDLYQKQVNLLEKSNQNGNPTSPLRQILSQEQKNSKNIIPAQDAKQIQKIKQKIKSKAEEHLKIDRQRQTEQHSRKVIDKNFSKEKENKKFTKNQFQQQCQTDDLGVSYNYFKYGEKLSLIQGRTIQFKHFKDISDPNHIPLIMRYIAAFLNTEGGKLYIGIDDNSYAYGAKFKQSEYDKLLLKIDNEGKFYMTPPLMPQKYNIKLIPVYHDRKGQERWVIQIMVFPPKEQHKKLFLYNRQCYMRMNASTHKLNAIDIIELMSLNNENQSKTKQQDQVVQKEQSKEERQANEKTKLTKDNALKSKRQNQLMSQVSPTSNATSKSRHKFQTQESKMNDFEEKLKSKSIEDLYAMRKDYEQKLKIITAAYKKKERQIR